ncbi:MAG: hypothetical protein FE78DRAFT_89545 [Acidomyces sp. 'richmondensis']|nr:MAG: hypothetical protein FE78DRAFT_89545 [Acidomyces sp. 'richmondensis']
MWLRVSASLAWRTDYSSQRMRLTKSSNQFHLGLTVRSGTSTRREIPSSRYSCIISSLIDLRRDDIAAPAVLNTRSCYKSGDSSEFDRSLNTSKMWSVL